LRNVKKADVFDSITTVLKLMNIPATFEEKSIVLIIENFRVATPPDLYKLKAVTSTDGEGRIGTRLKTSTDARIQHHGTRQQKAPTPVTAPVPTPIPGAERKEENWQVVTTRSMQTSNTITYKHVPGWIYTDFSTGMVELIYSAYKLDDNGFPLLPDNESLILAIENYIKFQYFTILFEMGQIAEKVLDRAEQQYLWYVGQASNSYDTPTEDEAEVIFDAICRLIPDREAFFTNFKYSSNTEQLKLHN